MERQYLTQSIEVHHKACHDIVITDFGESHKILQVNEVSAKCECEAGPGVGLPLDEFALFCPSDSWLLGTTGDKSFEHRQVKRQERNKNLRHVSRSSISAST